ncbi:uncharacterized protein LOC124916676 [Impatiens glandulifera]|uniref:uncharacterized protein LOC124916676 n=1 Tax=Impatiens glandulifera TaxID=253017 RepID=UPI001FB07D55|nr:uncharacterized protein LOC124916676 [Impatiens glandulifera]
MVENPRSAAGNKNLRWSEDSVAIDYPIKCNDKCCRSCAAGMIADSVAICCCPCSVVSFLALALVKAPLMICRRCLGLGKNERRREERNKKRVCEKNSNNRDMGGICRVEEGTSEIVFAIGDEKEENDEEDDQEQKEKENLSGRFEAERIWLELHQLGHLGFVKGQVSVLVPFDVPVDVL